MMRKWRREEEQQIYSSSEGERSTSRGRTGGQGCLVRLVAAFDEVFKLKEWMVALGEANKAIGTRLIGETFIISGPAQSGKASLVYWALRDDTRTAVVTVDCSLYRTDMQFIQRLTRELGEKIGASGLDRRVVASENIKFADLNAAIEEHGRPVVILIRGAERLVEARKQILLYNLLEWMLTDARKMVGLVFTTRLMFFVDRFEKRVKSRLAAKQLTVVRPEASHLQALLVRRVECLVEEERGGEAGRFFEKIVRCLHKNEELTRVIQQNQEVAHRDIVYYLNAMKLVFCALPSVQDVLAMPDRDLRDTLCCQLRKSFGHIFAFMPSNLLKTCTYPEYVIMAIVFHMYKHKREPYRFKTVFEVYLEFRQRLVTQEGGGSAFTYSKNVLERALLKLDELKLIELDSRDESLWNCDIRCTLYPEDISNAMNELKQQEKLPFFIVEILNS